MMHLKNSLRFIILLSCFISYSTTLKADDRITQTFELQPGWNAIFISVKPDDGDDSTENDAKPETVFNNVVGLDRVWGWIDSDNPVQFLQSADEIGFNEPGWFGYLPASAGIQASALTNLFKIIGGRTYLIKIDEGVQPSAQTLTVTGVPVNRRIRWTPDHFTLTGFAVDSTLGPGQTPTFNEFLDFPITSNPFIYGLNPNGNWVFLNKNAPIQAGQAYWVFNDGSFQSSGPLEVDLASLNGMDFLAQVATRSFTLTNRGEQTANPQFSFSSAFPLHFYDGEDAQTQTAEFPPITSLTPALNQGEGISVKLAINRSAMSDEMSSVLTIRGNKSEIHIPVYAAPSPPPQGLYVGSAVIEKISQANETDSATPTPVTSQLRFRVMLHLDANGTVSLLKTVYVMAQKGDPDPISGVTPLGDTVLVTDESRLVDFGTLQQAKGVAQGYRLSSPLFDFTEPHRELTCSSATALTSAGSCSINLVIQEHSATHPMRHPFHPNHDGQLPNGQPEPNTLQPHQREIWAIERNLTFQFNPINSSNLFSPLGQVSGSFFETIIGMHKNPIYLTGQFSLERVSDIDVLNPPKITVVP